MWLITLKQVKLTKLFVRVRFPPPAPALGRFRLTEHLCTNQFCIFRIGLPKGLFDRNAMSAASVIGFQDLGDSFVFNQAATSFFRSMGG